MISQEDFFPPPSFLAETKTKIIGKDNTEWREASRKRKKVLGVGIFRRVLSYESMQTDV